MTKFDDLGEYKARLRRIALHSADVLPDEVSAYLKEVAEHGYRDVQRTVFEEHRPLVDHLPNAYVDFALDFLIERPKEDTPFYGSDLGDRDLGIESDIHFFPPAHIRGPFLYLLRKDEDEGLRLILTLANTAVVKWREREEKPRSRRSGLTPLPIIISLSSGPREFWGNTQVYCWYRPGGNGPYAIISALMALEVWMEEQVEAGRNPEDLFEKVLGRSNCVAILAICLSITLAYPDKCLGAALPIVSSPAVWLMDIQRFAGDQIGSLKLDALGPHRYLYELQTERDKRPQRSLEIRNLAPVYLFSEDETLSNSFEQALARFAEDLPFLYEEMREDCEVVARLRERMENFQVLGNRENYRRRQVEGGIEIWCEPPEHIKARNEALLAPVIERQSWQHVSIWAWKTIDEGKVAAGMTAEEAITAAEQFLQPQDFSTPYETTRSDSSRLEAIAGVAAAVLLVEFSWTKEKGLIAWCRDVLLTAARMPTLEHFMDSRSTNYPLDPRVSAGRGLGALVARGVADDEVRERILRLVSDPHFQVVQAVLRGLRDAWTVDEVLCWNVLSLGLSLCLLPRGLTPRERSATRSSAEARWVKNMVNSHLRNLRAGIIPKLTRIPITKDVIFLWDLAIRVLHALPLSTLAENTATKAQLLQLTDDLMTWTIRENTRDQENRIGYQSRVPPLDWNSFFMEYASALARVLSFEETQEHILAPMRSSWPDTPYLTADLLNGYITHHLAYIESLTSEAIAGWRAICDWILDSPEIAKVANRHYLGSAMDDVVSSIVFVRHGRPLLKDEWPHAVLFYDVIDKWVSSVGYNPFAFSYLITMLNGPGWNLTPDPALEWTKRCVDASANIEQFWKEQSNGERTARLLQRMWNNAEEQIRGNTLTLQCYSDLIDQLVAAGTPLASVLRQRLEKRA